MTTIATAYHKAEVEIDLPGGEKGMAEMLHLPQEEIAIYKVGNWISIQEKKGRGSGRKVQNADIAYLRVVLGSHHTLRELQDLFVKLNHN